MRTEWSIGQEVQGRLAALRIPGASLLCDLDKAERNQLSDCARNRLAIDSVFDEVSVCAGQVSVFFRFEAVLSQLNFEPIQDLASGEAKDAIGGALLHLDEPPVEWARDVLFRDACRLPGAIAALLAGVGMAQYRRVSLSLFSVEELLALSHGRVLSRRRFDASESSSGCQSSAEMDR
jgi:hypothetical protein